VNAEVKVAEADVLRLAIGQPATVALEALPGRTFPGRVVEVGASALPVVGTGAAARSFAYACGSTRLIRGCAPASRATPTS
jgi:multidrug efflux pump subunit AcrA (membrane-fusion protein)